MIENINVCLACDDNYSMYAGVVIASILVNANLSDKLAFYILDGGIREEQKQKITSLKAIKNCEISFIQIDESLFEEYKKVKTHKYISLAACYRLRLPSLLPDISKVIYLDCDVIVNKSLYPLFNKELKNFPIAGVKDSKKKYLMDNPTYVNSGVLVMDLDNMRTQKIEEKFLKWAKEHIDTIKTGDQEIINEVCRGNILVLEDEWNVQSSNFTNRSSYTNSPKIIHYTAKRKPWHYGSFSYHRNLYFKYLQLTPWKLTDEDLKHWTKDNQRDSIIAYLKYRPFFFLRPKFYKALWCTYLLNLFSYIFSITDYGETHHLITILGLKIKFPKSSFARKRRENPYYYYKKNNIDIRTLPPAEGQIRDIQLANLALLKELDYVCKQNGLQYWIDFGSLLGAIRHKGFIPWDDDIDVGMLRQDYDKIIAAFEKSSRNPDIYVGYVRSEKNTCQYYLKIQHNKCPHLFVDIFPYDYYGEVLTPDKQLDITEEIKNRRKSMQLRCNAEMTNSEILEVILTERKNVIKDVFVEKSDLVWGIDFSHGWQNWFSDFDTIFPLKTIEFEEDKFACINKPEEYLEKVYGNYMAYPRKIGIGHNMYAKLKPVEKEVIKALVKEIKNS